MPRWRWGKRRKGRGRPPKPRWIEGSPIVHRLVPVFVPPVPPLLPREPVVLLYDEYEALRLVDLEGLTQEEVGERMGVSRGTVWRTLESARRKVAKALVEGRELIIAPAPTAKGQG
ncbi:TPA: DUF134 domain-containing protein [Candidatus Bathyarchaeota archaeon]|nr:DUF134 domain-containing protein [Candidatus Bathyarchaeota archaeon]